MRRRGSPPVLIYILAGALAAAVPASAARAADPVQWWNAFASGRELEKTTIDCKAETRLAEGGDVLLWNLEGNFLLKAGDRFSWGPGYKYERQRVPGGPFAEEHRFLLSGRAKLGVASTWMSSLRGLYEYRDREDQARSWRFRLRPEVRRALAGSGWDLAASDEVFYDSTRDRIVQNRLQIGVERPLGDKVSVLVYYIARSDRQDARWQETHVLGSVWKVQ